MLCTVTVVIFRIKILEKSLCIIKSDSVKLQITGILLTLTNRNSLSIYVVNCLVAVSCSMDPKYLNPINNGIEYNCSLLTSTNEQPISPQYSQCFDFIVRV